MPDFRVREYVTITKDPRTDLVLAIGGTDKAADILQRTDGFHSAAAGAYDGFPPRPAHRAAAVAGDHRLALPAGRWSQRPR
ncbi:hypothetical protein ACFWZK_06480 [[Kitasatospora] papulosa]|uniref:hypothetical protein n=1 Tax=[Kitasatospora] papulosa TaxID=1464011 RepID=UPI00367984E0